MGLGPKTHLINIYPIWSFIVFQVLSGSLAQKNIFFPFLFIYQLVLSFLSGLNLVLVWVFSSTFLDGARALYRSISQ